MKKVLEMPSWYLTSLPHTGLLNVGFTKELHPHHSKYEDDDTEDECEVSQSTNGFPHNGDEEVERRPGLGQLEHSQLGRR